MNSPEKKPSNKDSRPSAVPQRNAGKSGAYNEHHGLTVVGPGNEPASPDGDEIFIPRFSEVRSKRLGSMTEQELGETVGGAMGEPQSATVALPNTEGLATASLAIEMLAISSFDKCDAVSVDQAASLLPNMESTGSVDVQELGFHRHISEESRCVQNRSIVDHKSSTYYDVLISQNAVPAIELPSSSFSSNMDTCVQQASHSLRSRPSTYWVVEEARLVTHGTFDDFSQSTGPALKQEPDQEITHTLPIADIEEAVALNAIPVGSAGFPMTASADPSGSLNEAKEAAGQLDTIEKISPVAPVAGTESSNVVSFPLSGRETLPDALADSSEQERFVESQIEDKPNQPQGPQTLDLSQSPAQSNIVDTGPLPVDRTVYSGTLKNSSTRVKSPFLERAIGNAPPVIGQEDLESATADLTFEAQSVSEAKKVVPLSPKNELWKKRAFTAGSILVLCIACFAVMYESVLSGHNQPGQDEEDTQVDEAMSKSTEPEPIKEKTDTVSAKKLDPKEEVKLALKEEKEKNYSEALAHYNAALDSRKTVKALHGRGRVLTKLQRFEDALKDLEFASKISPSNQDVTIDLAAARYMLNDFDGAVQEYNRILSVRPEDADALYGRGISLAGLKDNESALKDFEHVVKLRPAYQPAYRQMCTTYMEMGQNDKAEAAITVALTACGEDSDLYFSRGLARYRMGHNVDGLEDYNHALKLDPKRKEFYNDRGYVLMQLGKNEQATSDFKKALEIDPDYTLASENLSKVQGKIEK